MIHVETFDEKARKEEKPHEWQWLCQPMEIWRPDQLGPSPLEMHVFPAHDAEWFDMLSLCGCDPIRRSQFTKWRAEEIADVGDTLRLTNVGVASPRCSLSSPKVPVLSLVDALLSQGYMGRDALVVHKPRSGLFYDQRNLASKQKYLQCVLAQDDLWKRGNKQFRSDCPVSFYTLLLSSPKPVECLPKNQACLDDLKALTNKVDESKMLVLALQAPTPGAPACTDIVAVDGEDDPSHVDLLPLPPPEPEALLALPPPLEEPQPLVDGSGGQSSSSHPSPFLSSQPHPHHSFRANPPPRLITTTTTSCVLIVPTRRGRYTGGLCRYRCLC